MAQSSQSTADGGWLRASGLLDIVRTLGFAVHPAKLVLALAGVLATLVYGGLLDWVWSRNGGIAHDAVDRFIISQQMDQTYVEGAGDYGVFQAWREHERNSLLGLLGSPVVSVSRESALRDYVEMRASRAYRPWYSNLADMGRGVWWMARVHPWFFVLFAAGALFIWALVGGAICRIAAMQFARDERITARDALIFAWRRIFGGFMLAPVIPIAFIVLISAFLILGGVFLRIPVLGDILGAPLFVFALLGGFFITILIVGLVVGGSLFWPSVAVEGSDAFDAFSRSLAYPFSRPWKAILYFLLVGVYAVVCWLVVNLIVNGAILITRGIVSWGTSPFGWWRGEGNATKLERIWPLGGTSGLHQWPDWSQLGFFEDLSAFVIGIYVLLAIGLTWAFLFSFCLSADTIVYFLLRRDVDGNDTSDIYLDETKGTVSGSPARSTEGATAPSQPAQPASSAPTSTA